LLTSGGSPRCFDGALKLRKCGACVIKKRQSRIGQLHAARLAVEELDVELALDSFNLLAQWWLLHAKALRGAGDVPLLGDRNEITQMPEL
jgi:hypothetical protein